MKWVTRERPKIDRVACPWLIARFIDRHPDFLFVPAQEVTARAAATGASPFDVDGGEPGHLPRRVSLVPGRRGAARLRIPPVRCALRVAPVLPGRGARVESARRSDPAAGVTGSALPLR